MAKSKKVNKKTNSMIIIGVTIIVVAILIIAGVFAYTDIFKEEKIAEKEEEFILDNRVSPFENQALVLEVLRIRHRGLYDKLMSPGRGWRDKPSFYYIANLDGLEYVSKDVEHLGKVEEILFTGWDTMFQENKIMRDAEEEQNYSEVTITLMEKVKSGILGRRSKDVERGKIHLTYNYKTGRWYGDDSFRDYDGYGHWVGETFELWFNIYQIDSDLDYIPYWTEVNVLGTDPQRDDSDKDPDGDGIPTAWEWRWGYDPFTWDDHEKLDPDIDGIENIEEYQLAKWLADPFSQDIYVEVDYMGKGGLLDPPHILWEECQQAIIEKYAEHNIKMYFDQGWPDTPLNGGGEVLPHYDQISQDSGMILQFYNHNFPDERKGSFRYVVMGHAGPFNHPAKSNVYDTIHIAYNFGLMTHIKNLFVYKMLPTARGFRIKVASTLMHELGHSVGISPWTFEGCDNLTYTQGRAARNKFDETWGDYYSVMNYYHMYSIKLLDYSDGSNGPPYDQNDWLMLFVPSFQYNSELIEEIFFHPPGFDKIVYGETETSVTGYVYDEEFTEKLTRDMKGWSPVDPIDANWLVFKLEDKDKYPNYMEIKILVQPDVPYAGWALYGEGKLDEDGNIIYYSQDDIISEITS
ncbi:MAG: hypothetical protein AYK22_08980 [Thermoplasmatales archaeon SG8-52-3]|nr:MAG: hypothetical protein AYK22_08980 [Thermoplasmatales archaeon SG8-52-3]